MVKIQAKLRDNAGTSVSRALRGSGWVPSVVYGHGLDPVLVQVDARDMTRELKRRQRELEATLYDLEIEGQDEVLRVLPRQMQLHPVTDNIQSVNFLVYQGRAVVDLPLVPMNEELSPALRRGAAFLQTNRSISVVVTGDSFPSKLEVDLEGAVAKEVIKLNRVAIPPNVRVHKPDRRYVIGTIKGKRMG